jgi:hypothetical protein
LTTAVGGRGGGSDTAKKGKKQAKATAPPAEDEDAMDEVRYPA